MKRLLLSFTVLISLGQFVRSSFAQQKPTPSSNNVSVESKATATINSISPRFLENRGQWRSDAKFLMQVPGIDMWITKNGVLYDLNTSISSNKPGARATYSELARCEDNITTRKGHVVSMSFAGVSPDANPVPSDVLSGTTNYFFGNVPEKWVTSVRSFGNVELRHIYDGIDAEFYLDNNVPRYDILVRAGTDPAKVRMHFAGQDGLFVAKDGGLVIRTSMGDLEERGLYAYQNILGVKHQVACAFQVDANGDVTFKTGAYDLSQPLTIDPLVASTYLGGGSVCVANAVAVDASKNMYIGGYSNTGTAPAFPTTAGAYQTTIKSTQSSFVAKFSADGTTLIYSTFLGGSTAPQESANGLAVDASGNLYIAGTTRDGTFPTTAGAFQTTEPAANPDAYVTKLNSTGTALIYSTYLGSPSFDYGFAIALDASNNAYVTGISFSKTGTFPVTAGAYKTTSSTDAVFVTKLNTTGTALVYSTLLAGTDGIQGDIGYGIAVDATGEAYVTGYTSDTDFPLVNAYQSSNPLGGNNSSYTGFVSKFNASGSALAFSTFLGSTGPLSNGFTDCFAIALDGSGNCYVTGVMNGTGFPTTAGAYQTSGAGSEDAFVTKLSPTGAIGYSTLLGGPGNDFGYGISVNSSGEAIAGGYTSAPGATSFPTTAGAYQSTSSSITNDVFITQMNAAGSALVYSTLIGGAHTNDEAHALTVDASGNIVVAGHIQHFDAGANVYPSTAGAYQSALAGIANAFVTSFSTGLVVAGSISLTAPTAGTTWCPASTQNITYTSTGITNVKVEVSSNGGTSWTTLTSTAGSSSYAWVIPNNQTSGTNYEIRVSDAANAATNSVSGVFTINPLASMTVVLKPGILWPPSGALTTVNATTITVGGCSPTPSLFNVVSNETLAGGDIQNQTVASTKVVAKHTNPLHGRFYQFDYLVTDGTYSQSIVKGVLAPRNLGTAFPTAVGVNSPTIYQTDAEPLIAGAHFKLTFSAPATGVSINIYNDQGKLIQTLAPNASYPTGSTVVAWNQLDRSGNFVHVPIMVQAVSATDHSAPLTVLLQ